MDPRWHVYEHHVASVLQREGWTCTVAPRGPDGGVDVVAQRDGERVAVQVKMYRASGRRVKQSDVRNLYGAAALIDCARAMLATDTALPATVREACDKLGIEVREIPSDEMDDPPEDPPPHWGIWISEVAPLEGRTIRRTEGEPSLITHVDSYGLRRVTRGSGSDQLVPIAAFEWLIVNLRAHGHVSRAAFQATEHRGRYAGFLFDLLANLRDFEIDPNSPARTLRRRVADAV